MDAESIRQLAPHYLLMLVLLVAVTTVLRAVAPGLGFGVLVMVAILVGVLYPVAVHLLGVAPEPWQR